MGCRCGITWRDKSVCDESFSESAKNDDREVQRATCPCVDLRRSCNGFVRHPNPLHEDRSTLHRAAVRWKGVLPSVASLSITLRSIASAGMLLEEPGGCVKKLKHEAELFKAALLAGVQYAQGRKAVEFEATDSASDKALYVYRLLVHDKIISPMPEDQVGEKTIRHRLATWYAHQLPEGHPLLE
jgi:hypothetical protein